MRIPVGPGSGTFACVTLESGAATLVGLGDRDDQLTLVLRTHGFPLLDFEFLGICHSFLFSISSIWNENIYPMLVHTEIWKLIICPASQVHRLRRILLQDE